jgi:type II secretory pathway pseudopilin PulG
MEVIDMNNNTKKGAMFGLDARIALAIFGALSVISGAALYSAIQNAKVVSIIANLNEVSKAIEAYMLDTGQDITPYGTTDSVLRDLIEKPIGVTGWNGPYINRKNNAVSATHGVFFDFPEYNTNLAARRLDDNLGAANYGQCTIGPCYYWISAGNITESAARAVDEYIDGSYTPTSGKVRIIDSSPSSIFIKGPIMFTQP